MTYGKRLGEAMIQRGDVRGRKVTRLELAEIAGCSRENIGMILTNSKGKDQKLSIDSHAKVVDYLRVDSQWLLTGEGEMMPKPPANAPTNLSTAAIDIAVLFDMIPTADRIKRATAYNEATSAIMRVLQP